MNENDDDGYENYNVTSQWDDRKCECYFCNFTGVTGYSSMCIWNLDVIIFDEVSQ